MPVTRHHGVRIAYEVVDAAGPAAPDLVLVHGLGYARWGWEPVVGPLAEKYRLVLIDNRGIGRSDTPPGPYDTATMAGDVLAVLDDMGTERVHLMGTSLGGMIAQQVALMAPERIAQLVLVCTTPGGDIAYPLPRPTLELIARMPYLPAEEALRVAVSNALSHRTVAERPAVAERILAHRRNSPQDVDGWSAQAAAGTGHALGRGVRAISRPTLVLHGDEDQVVDVRNAGVLAEQIPDCRVVVLPGLGHLLFWDDPARFVAELSAFLT
jgi:pimeloyl-ACP methyl ester carboxylesterase